MKSIKYRKLMQGLGTLVQKQPESFSMTVSPGVTCECSLQCWHCEQLLKIEQCQPPTALLQRFATSLQLPQQILGKKSSQILISKDERLCLKNINEGDLSTLQKMLNDYAHFKKHEKDSILVPLFAILVLKTDHNENHSWIDYFALMPNLKPLNCTLFDIKGHTDSRLVPPSDFKDFSFGKDENFRKSQHRKALKQAPLQIRKNLIEKVEKNIQFLKKHQVIDYSLVLIFQDSSNIPENSLNSDLNWIPINERFKMTYYIIDFLQTYNERKKLENKVKSLFFKSISSVDPETYANRLLAFLEKSLF